MSKKTTNLLLTLLIIIIGGYLLFQSLPMVLAFATNTLYVLFMLIMIPLCIYGIYKLVSFLNK